MTLRREKNATLETVGVQVGVKFHSLYCDVLKRSENIGVGSGVNRQFISLILSPRKTQKDTFTVLVMTTL